MLENPWSLVKILEVKVIKYNGRELLLEVEGEDHTLGNLLVKEAIKHPLVEYASYRVPHPLKNTIQLTVVVKEGGDAIAVVREIVDSLKSQLLELKKILEEKVE